MGKGNAFLATVNLVLSDHPKDEYNAVYKTGGILIQVVSHTENFSRSFLHDLPPVLSWSKGLPCFPNQWSLNIILTVFCFRAIVITVLWLCKNFNVAHYSKIFAGIKMKFACHDMRSCKSRGISQKLIFLELCPF